METKFTKGEWSIDGYFIVSESNKLICDMKPEHENDVAVFELSLLQNSANAKLIAAAPEMFKALIEIYETSKESASVQCAFEAIKKATE